MKEKNLPGTVVECDWLNDHLDLDDLIIFDASWHMPGTERDGYIDFQQAHIPKAQYFDFDRVVCDQHAELPHMLPEAGFFTGEMQKMGLNKDSKIVVYDTSGLFSSPRVWWMLKVMGCVDVAILNGGLPAWKAKGFVIEASEQTGFKQAKNEKTGNFEAQLDSTRVCGTAEVLAACSNDMVDIIDARPQSRFEGDAEEPRPGLRRGHMPGAQNLPFNNLVHDGRLLSRDELFKEFSRLTRSDKKQIYSCGSGVTACVLAFAAQHCGFDNFIVYDGSWSEWGLPGELPVEVGA